MHKPMIAPSNATAELTAALVADPKARLSWDDNPQRAEAVLAASKRVAAVAPNGPQWRKPAHTPTLLEQMGAPVFSGFDAYVAKMEAEIAQGRARRNGTSAEHELVKLRNPPVILGRVAR